MQQVALTLRQDGRLRHFRGVDDADVARLQLARDAGLLRALQQRFVHLPVALGFALQHAVLDALAVQAERLGLLRFERADQAALLRQRRLVFALHRLDDLGDLALRAWPRRPESPLRIFTISGWRSPYFSASCACCRCRSAELGLHLLDVVVRQHRGQRCRSPACPATALNWL